MPEHIVWFYLVFSSQVLLLSFYVPRRVLGRLRHVVETYPPATYPKLYPVSMDALAQTQRHYRNLNMFALMCGVALLLSGIYSGGDELLSWDTQSVLTLYFFLQMSPGLLLTRAILNYYKLMRRANSRTTRKAELRPRRLLDFISPTIIVVAVATYVAFVLLVFYIRQDPFPGFAGYWNVAVITAGNLFFAGFAFWSLYGKKVDPHQAHQDRRREIGRTVRILAVTSIAATTILAVHFVLALFDLRHLTDTFSSLYLQALVVFVVLAIRVDHIDFDVYREDQLAT